ncbi:hypothetical protein NPX13_g8189 [Xylaria arbuscula]|uniref:Uncharacterized protein n=1 Tax=Xylaria arbuscula TaxID=114810 RepID=A0A9W8N8W3_9PEZI|nr:hypothetical protein NPX13_g8189 [Xylaria arbuscula]
MEYEHRWMHERGACDCEVRFPGIWQPRLIKRSSTMEDGSGTPTSTRATAGACTSAGSSAFLSQANQSSHLGQGDGLAVPMYVQTQVGDKVEVAVRLSSLYGAEWIKDHAKLHESGKCSCSVSFERYKPDYDQGDNDFPEPDHSQLQNQPWYPMNSRNPTAPAPVSPPYNPYVGTSSIAENSTNAFNQTPPGHVARWAGEAPQGSLLDEILGPVRPDASAYRGRPVDIQTVHFSNIGTPIAGNPIVCGALRARSLRLLSFTRQKEPLPDFLLAPVPKAFRMLEILSTALSILVILVLETHQ